MESQGSEALEARSNTYSLRSPRLADSREIWRLVCESEQLDRNSPYAYLLLCSDFAATSLVAEASGRVIAFVCGYRPPDRSDTVFVWQIGVAREARRCGTGAALLDGLLAQPGCRDVMFLEATVTPSNTASYALFSAFARRHQAALHEDCGFAGSLFPGRDHEDEIRLRIGPLGSQASNA